MGQVSSPAGASWKITSVDRELSPGTNTGAAQSGNRVIMLGQNTGTNTTASDLVLLGADVLGSGVQADTTLVGSVFVGSQAGALLKTNNLNTVWDASNPTVAIGYGVFSGFLPQTNAPLNSGVVIGAYAMQMANVSGATSFFQGVVIGNNIGKTSVLGAPTGLSQSVIIGWGAGKILQGLTNSTIVGWKFDDDGAVLQTNVSNTVSIGAGNRASFGSIGNVNDNNTLIGTNTFITAAPRSFNCLIAGNISVSGSNNTFIGNGSNATPLPLASLATGSNGLCIGTTGSALITGNISAGNIQFGATTGDTGRDYGSGTGSATNLVKLLNGTITSIGPAAGGVLLVSAGSLGWFDQNSKRSTLTGPIVSDGTYVKIVPTTGFTQAMTASVLQIVPAGLLATGTITLPVVTAANDGAIAEISTTQQITLLTINADAGHTVVGAPTSINANIGFSFRYNATDGAWYRRY